MGDGAAFAWLSFRRGQAGGCDRGGATRVEMRRFGLGEFFRERLLSEQHKVNDPSAGSSGEAMVVEYALTFGDSRAPVRGTAPECS